MTHQAAPTSSADYYAGSSCSHGHQHQVSASLARAPRGLYSNVEARTRKCAARRVQAWKGGSRAGGMGQAQVERAGRASCAAAIGRGASAEAPPAAAEVEESSGDSLNSKEQLLGLVAGLNRGLLAGEEDVRAAEALATRVEAEGGGVKEADLAQLQGRWRLVFSSAFELGGSFGGRRPGPPLDTRLPFTLGQVYQRIDVVARELDNIVELCISTPWPLPPLVVTATLAHTLQFIGDSEVEIIFEKTSAKFGDNFSQWPPLALPQLPNFLRPSPNIRSGKFQVTYLDDNLRISRGDRGELRVFVRA